ncbi:hypothetical protein C900_04988 [Fulvivirga imtechensis AK7]|uniref:DUF1684 domain-containing protein n=1 Tax=Fulvivirga imtechensis AK7 TaxID=1237149 RepID=L8JKK2_9BACT|nr:DUF1684 domain-containing protein [Fulvivirga imtechensis]ELR69456.1 hypothetical protein C900_04988 [Fulvivirga imtechensis AK7]
MTRNRIIYTSVFLIIVVIIIYSLNGESPEAYQKTIIKAREKQDSFMRNSEESPFVQHNVQYHGLHYFEPDLKYKINARFESIADKKIRKLPTSDNLEKEYLEYGYAHFELGGRKEKLLILENVKEKLLFLAFGDATSANETYGGGRYLEVTHDGSNSILLDFNKAYNPYCAYTEGYSCPLPPRENLLEVAIKAGEKNYDH